MRFGGRTLGVLVVILAVLLGLFALYYTESLREERNQTIEDLMSLPPEAECNYDDPGLCPQVEENIVLPNPTAIGVLILAILIGVFLFRSEKTQGAILTELKGRRIQKSSDETRNLIYSVLTPDEKKIVEAVRKQPGITQATLRLRTDLSKAKLSTLLKDLEKRGILKKIEEGRTNTVHLKMEL